MAKVIELESDRTEIKTQATYLWNLGSSPLYYNPCKVGASRKSGLSIKSRVNELSLDPGKKSILRGLESRTEQAAEAY